MKQIEKILILALISISPFAFGQERERIPGSEIKEIIELAIELPELQQYFHIDEKPSRAPLIIKEFGIVNSKNLDGLKKFGLPIKVINEKTIKEKGIEAYLNIGDWTYVGNTLRLQIDYTVEGITINFMLNRVNGEWKIIDSIILEE